jgi:hypothetical protein
MGDITSFPDEEFEHFTDEDFASFDAPPEAPEELYAYWNDPDGGICSGKVKVLGSEGDHVIVERDGTTFEVFDEELVYSPGDGIFYG